ncbi:unnamed protein product [Symbiodinium microadriaticum]
MCDAVTHQVLKDKLKQAERDFKYPFAYQFRYGLDATVETALRVVAMYTPKQSRPRFILRPQKNRTSSLQVRVEGIRGTTSAKILGQTDITSCRDDPRLKGWFRRLGLDPEWGRAWLLEVQVWSPDIKKVTETCAPAWSQSKAQQDERILEFQHVRRAACSSGSNYRCSRTQLAMPRRCAGFQDPSDSGARPCLFASDGLGGPAQAKSSRSGRCVLCSVDALAQALESRVGKGNLVRRLRHWRRLGTPTYEAAFEFGSLLALSPHEQYGLREKAGEAARFRRQASWLHKGRQRLRHFLLGKPIPGGSPGMSASSQEYLQSKASSYCDDGHLHRIYMVYRKKEPFANVKSKCKGRTYWRGKLAIIRASSIAHWIDEGDTEKCLQEKGYEWYRHMIQNGVIFSPLWVSSNLERIGFKLQMWRRQEPEWPPGVISLLQIRGDRRQHKDYWAALTYCKGTVYLLDSFRNTPILLSDWRRALEAHPTYALVQL